MTSHDADVIIIGGGISGLATAWQVARRGRRALVLERTGRPGGALCTARTPDGTWYELGAHTCYNSYGGVLDILEEREALGRLLPRRKAPFRLLIDGELRSVMGALSLPRLLLSLPRGLPRRDKRGETVREHFSRLVGAKNYERVLGPMLAAVPSQRADEMPAEMLFKRRPRRKGIARSFTLDGGLGSLAELIAARPGVELRTGEAAVGISELREGWVVRTEAGAELRAGKLVLAVPPPVGARIVGEARPELAAALSRIEVVAIDSVGFALPEDRLKIERVAGIIPRDDDLFWSAVSRDVVPSPGTRAFTFHFRAGLSASAMDTRASEVLGVDLSCASHRAATHGVLPAPRLGHREILAAIARATPDRRLAVAGNFFAGLAIEDCVQRAAEVARQLLPTS